MEGLLKKLRAIPDPTPEEKKAMHRQAMEFKKINGATILTAYSVLEDQRVEAYHHVTMRTFLREYLESYGVRSDVIETIRSELDLAESAIANNAFDLMEGKTFDPTIMTKHSENAMNLALLAIGKDPTERFTEEQSEETYTTFAAHFAAEQAFLVSGFSAADHVKNDDVTRWYGFEPDPLWEGTEAEIEARFTTGQLEKPEWWDGRFKDILQEFEYIGAGEKLRRSRSPRRKNTAPVPNNGIPADARTRFQILFDIWDSIKNKTPSLSRNVIRIIEFGGPVVETMINFFIIYILLTKGWTVWTDFILGDSRKLEAFEEATANMSDAMDTTVVSARRVGDITRQYEADFAKTFQQLYGSNFTSFSYFQGFKHMTRYQGPLPDVCPVIEDPTFNHFSEGRRMIEFWFQLRLFDGLPSIAPENIVEAEQNLLKTYYEVISDPGSSHGLVRDMTQRFMKFTDATYGRVNLETFTSEREGVLLGEKFLELIRREALQPAVKRLLEDVERLHAEKMVTWETIPPVIKIAEHAAEHTPVAERMVRDTNLPRHEKRLLVYLIHVLGITARPLYTSVVSAAQAREFMNSLSPSTSAIEFALNAPMIPTRMGMFLLCNAWSFTWLVHLVGFIEKLAKKGIDRMLKDYDHIKTMRLKGVTPRPLDPLNLPHTYFFVLARSVVPSVLGWTKWGLVYATWIGLLSVFTSILWYVGRFNISLTSRTDLLALATSAVGMIKTRGWEGIATQEGLFMLHHWIGNVFTASLSGISIGHGFYRAIKQTGNWIQYGARNTIYAERDRDPTKTETFASMQRMEGIYSAFSLMMIVIYGILYIKGMIGRQISDKPAWSQYKTRQSWREKL
jgi:hypothetical protein